MTLAELYAKLEELENGKDLVDGFKSEIAKINKASKDDRLKFESQIAELTKSRDGLQSKIDEFEAHKGDKTPELVALEKQLKAMNDKFEASEKARQEETNKRIDSEISAQTVAALNKANAIDSEEFSKIIRNQITVQDDGSYGYSKEDGTVGTIEECVNAWLDGKDWAVKATQNGGSGAGAGNGGDNTGLADVAAAMGVKM